MDSLIETLAKIIRNSDHQCERMNAVFCLSLMSFNESGLNRLLDHCEAIRERLNDNAELQAYTQKTLMVKLTNIPFLK